MNLAEDNNLTENLIYLRASWNISNKYLPKTGAWRPGVPVYVSKHIVFLMYYKHKFSPYTGKFISKQKLVLRKM